jgi:predicted NAD-dependent protein-ADP-ribosyltransferase YbiA (DUF1768 family)
MFFNINGTPLDNEWQTRIIVRGYEFESGKHALEGLKFLLSADPRLAEHGLKWVYPSSPTKKTLPQREKERWKYRCIDIQLEICREKLKDDAVRNALNNPLIFIQPSRNKDWNGKGILKDNKPTVIGHNTLANIWMELRDNSF